MAHDIDDDGCRRVREANVDTDCTLNAERNQICRPSGYFFGWLFGACPKPSNINRILGGGFFLNRFPISRCAFLVCFSHNHRQNGCVQVFWWTLLYLLWNANETNVTKRKRKFFLSQNVSIVRSIRLASIKLFSFKYFFSNLQWRIPRSFFFLAKILFDILKLFFFQQNFAKMKNKEKNQFHIHSIIAKIYCENGFLVSFTINQKLNEMCKIIFIKKYNRVRSIWMHSLFRCRL